MKWMRHIAQWLLSVVLMVAGHAHAANPGDYVLGSGDIIRVTVFQNVDLTLEARLSETGTIS